MRVTVLYFARLHELAGEREWICEIANGARVIDVWQAGVQRAPGIGALAGSISCAVNADFSTLTAIVHDGDEVAFLPPVSGGASLKP
jgi:molybdopterin converting factor subunit 1